VLPCTGHHGEHLLNEVEGHVLVEEIAHRVDEDELRARPVERRIQGARVRCNAEPVPVVRLVRR